MIATPQLDLLRNKLSIELPAISGALAVTNRQIVKLTEDLGRLAPSDSSIVVFGSLARGEVTTKSDVDWTLLVDGQAYASHADTAVEIDDKLVELRYKKPGKEGTFGGLAFSHDVVHYIGGGVDTNRNTTQRILLLLESIAIGPCEPYERVRLQVLKRYIEEDFGWVHRANPNNVPRFLQNDIARYWRTVAVDFAYKRRERQSEGWALRTVKLRMSRKLTYVSGLLACYSCAAVPLNSEGPEGEQRAFELVTHLRDFLKRPPLETVAAVLVPLLGDSLIAKAATNLYLAYNDFLDLLNDDDRREALEQLSPEAAAKSDLYESARDIGHRFQEGLTAIFLEPNTSDIYRLTKIYGVF